MTPFQEFRLWLRRAPNSQRVPAAIVTIVVLGLVAWAIVPASTSSSSGGGTGTTSAEPVSVSSTPPTPVPPPSKCTNPSTSVPGITDKTIKLGVILVNVTGLANNASLGILPYATEKSIYSKMIDSINSSGGVDCRQIVPYYVQANPGDQSSLQQVCLQMVQAGVFATVDAGAFAAFPVVTCFGQHHTPYFGGYLLPDSEMQQFYPYLFELNSLDTVYHDTIGGLSKLGWFTAAKGFKKLGLMYHDCYPEIHTEVLQWLATAGVKPSQIVQQDLGCPSAFASPTALEEAILKFKSAHVTNVMPINMVGDLATFTKIAGGQNFKPIYGFPDDSLIAISYGTEAPDYANIANSLSITASRDAEDTTPSLTANPTPGTVKCSGIIGVNVYKLAAAAGNACDELWMFSAAVEHAPTLSQTTLPQGLQAAKSVEFSFPQGPNDFAAGKQVTYAGQYWRVAQFLTSCKAYPGGCWQVIDPNFKPSVS
jgi:hypothetical protein